MTVDITLTHTLSPGLADAIMALIEAVRGAPAPQPASDDVRRIEAAQTAQADDLREFRTALDHLADEVAAKPDLQARLVRLENLLPGLAEMGDHKRRVEDLDAAVGVLFGGLEARVDALEARIAAPAPRAAVVEQPRRPSSTGANPDWLTPERARILDRDWPAGVPVSDIRDTMLAQHGPDLPGNDRIAMTATCRKLRRPEGYIGTPKLVVRVPPAVPVEPERSGPPSPHSDAERIVSVAAAKVGLKVEEKPVMSGASTPRLADWAQIETWAAVRGIIFDGDNLDEVNRKARQLGLPEFRLKNAVRARG